MRPIEFRILGPLELRSGGEPIPLGGPRQRALLAILLLSADRVVSRDRLIDELWAGDPPLAAGHALDVHVSRLRKALQAAGSADSMLVTRPPGYLLSVAAGELDGRRFEQLLEEGRRTLEDGDPASAARALRAAEGLWRGRPLADLELENSARVEVGRLEELRLVAIEERIEAELALGLHRGLVAELEALVEEHPLRERPRAQLMLALYRSERQAEALDAFRAGSTMLVERLGLDPSPRLRQLQEAILRQDDTLALHNGARHESAAPAPPARTARRSRARWPLTVAGAGLAAALVLAWLPSEDTGAGRAAAGNGLVAFDDGRIASSVALRAPPTRATAGFGALWVTQFDTGTIVRVDDGDHVGQTIRVGSGPSGVAAGAGAVWVANSLDGSISRVDPETGEVVQTIRVGTGPADVAIAAGRVWVANAGGHSISDVEPRSGRVARTIALDDPPTALAADTHAVWVTSTAGDSVVRIDARTGAVSARIGVGGGPAAVATGAGAVWVANSLDGTVSRIDPARNAVAATIPVGDGPAAVAVTERAVWVANEFAGTLSRIDPATNRLSRTLAAGEASTALTAYEGRLWAGVQARGPSHRGGRLVLLNPNRAFNSFDPASSYELLPPALIGMTNDGLVTFKHVGGSDGNQLVPDLAIALPRPSDGGRSYAFRLHSGVLYSTGRPVRASDFRRALERLFEQRSAGTVFYGGIVGAAACARERRRCDLSRGVVADDAAGVVTIRLREPDPTLLHKLALPYAYAVPSATSGRRATSPLPATGPYMIDSYSPGRELRLVRNPRFREWSQAARPDGYADEIVWKLGIDPGAAVDAIARGRADWMLGAVPASRLREIERRHAGQLHVHSTLMTDYFVLNVREPPFDDVRARRAINYAIDRRAAVRLYGGAKRARPTCQVLPPQLPGYRRHCPYGDGPDLARARRLVARSGTAGMPVVVLDSTTPAIYRDEGRLVVRALRRIGYRARLALLPDDVFVRVAGNASKVRSHMQSGAWAAEYPDASNFIELKLSCSAFHPNSDDNPNSGGFCKPRLDRLMRRAGALTRADPRAAADTWARVDRALVDTAAWLPLVTPTNSDFVSDRVGNYRYHPLWGLLVDQLWVR